MAKPSYQKWTSTVESMRDFKVPISLDLTIGLGNGEVMRISDLLVDSSKMSGLYHDIHPTDMVKIVEDVDATVDAFKAAQADRKRKSAAETARATKRALVAKKRKELAELEADEAIDALGNMQVANSV